MLELAVGVYVDGVRFRGDGTGSVLAQIESRDGEGLFASPMADAKIPGVLFIDFGAGGDQFQMARPAHSEVVRSEIRLIAQVGIPAFARADEEHAVARVFDDIAAVVKMNRILLAFFRGLREHDLQIIIATDAAFLKVHPFVLEISQRLALVVRDGIGVQRAGKLKRQNDVRRKFRARRCTAAVASRELSA